MEQSRKANVDEEECATLTLFTHPQTVIRPKFPMLKWFIKLLTSARYINT